MMLILSCLAQCSQNLPEKLQLVALPAEYLQWPEYCMECPFIVMSFLIDICHAALFVAFT